MEIDSRRPLGEKRMIGSNVTTGPAVGGVPVIAVGPPNELAVSKNAAVAVPEQARSMTAPSGSCSGAVEERAAAEAEHLGAVEAPGLAGELAQCAA